MAAHLDFKPKHADVGAHQLLVHRLGDQRGVGAIAAQMRHQRAVAGRFLFDHGLQIDRRRRLQADATQRLKRVEIGRMARLHVGSRRVRRASRRR